MAPGQRTERRKENKKAHNNNIKCKIDAMNTDSASDKSSGTEMKSCRFESGLYTSAVKKVCVCVCERGGVCFQEAGNEIRPNVKRNVGISSNDSFCWNAVRI